MGDKDLLRFTLTSEASMKDGGAFPFVMQGLAMISVPGSYESPGAWMLKDVSWSTVSALVMGRWHWHDIRECLKMSNMTSGQI